MSRRCQVPVAALLLGLLLGVFCGSSSALTMDQRLRALAGRYNGGSTTFMASNLGQQASGFAQPVIFDACGRPLCPPAPAPQIPPAAYVCDCTSLAPHPDCGCNSLSSCDCSNPACPCNRGPIVGQNFPMISDAAPLGTLNPQHHIKYFSANAFNPPSTADLPSLREDECRPNIAAVGPGNCRKTPSNLGCTSQFSNCAQPTPQQTQAMPVQQQNMLVECQKKGIAAKDCIAPATQLRCPCKSAAPAPCVCRHNAAGVLEDIGEEEDYESEQQIIAKNEKILANLDLNSADALDRAFAKDLQDDCTLKKDACANPTGQVSALDQAAAILSNQHNDLKQDIDKFARVFKTMTDKAGKLNDPVLQAALDAVKTSGSPAPVQSQSASTPVPIVQASQSSAQQQPKPQAKASQVKAAPLDFQKGSVIGSSVQSQAPRFRGMVPAVISMNAADLVPQHVEIA